MKSILLIAAFCALALCDPAYPEWPKVFSAAFHEDMNYGPISGETDGMFYYNWGDDGKHVYRVDRENGKNDRYCGINGLYKFKNKKCQMFVDEHGDRYLNYPEDNYCCFCCSAAKGCGVLRRDWLNNATFLGEEEYNGVKAYKWDKPGLQSNYYWETIAENPLDRVMLAIDQVPNDLQVFKKETFSTDVPNGIFDLPSTCDRQKSCNVASTCYAVEHFS